MTLCTCIKWNSLSWKVNILHLHCFCAKGKNTMHIDIYWHWHFYSNLKSSPLELLASIYIPIHWVQTANVLDIFVQFNRPKNLERFSPILQIFILSLKNLIQITPTADELSWTFVCHTFIKLSHMSHVMRKPVFAMCEQQRRRSAYASTQSDQHFCCSLPG